MLWIGEVEDAKHVDGTSTSKTGDPTLDFENLDFKIASGLGKILTGRRLLTGRKIAWVIYDSFKICGDNAAILEVRDFSKVQLKDDKVQAFDKVKQRIISSH